MNEKLVLLHGWAMNPGIWRSVEPRLRNSFDLCAMTLPSYVESGAEEYPTDRSSAFALLDTWVDALLERAPQTATWLGWSLGGQLAIRAALRAPDRVKALILVSTTPRFAAGDDWHHGVVPDLMKDFFDAFRRDPDKAMNRFLTLQVGEVAQARDLVRQARSDLSTAAPVSTPTLLAGLKILEWLDLRDKLGELRVPVTVIHGGKDVIVPSSAGAFIADTVPQCTWHCLSQAGHLPFLVEPGAFTEAVLA